MIGIAADDAHGEARAAAAVPGRQDPDPGALVVNRQRLREILARDGIDVLLGTSPENAFYLTGFQSFSQWAIRGRKVPVMGVATADCAVTLVAPAGEIDRFVVAPTRVDDVVTFGSIAASPGDRMGWAETDRRLHDLALTDGRPASLWEALDTLLRPGGRSVAVDDVDLIEPLRERYGGRIIDGRATLAEIRLIKSPEEVARLRRVVEITEDCLARALERLDEGMTERSIAEIYDAEVVYAGAEPCLRVIGFGGHGAYGNHIPGGARLRSGEVTRWDVGCRHLGYVADIARSSVLGDPTGAVADEWEAVLAGHLAALKVIRPGVLARDIHAAGVAGARAAGTTSFASRSLGHGIGIDMYEAPMIVPDDDTEIEAGMVFEIEVIHKVLGTSGIHVEDTVHVTPAGRELLTTLPHRLLRTGERIERTADETWGAGR